MLLQISHYEEGQIIGRPELEETDAMTTKLSGSMQNVLKRMGNGDDYDDFGVDGPLSLAARVRTCDALVKRGLMVQTLFGHYLLTEAGEALAGTLNAVSGDLQTA
ncbi:hypothetical protein ALQ64_01917 [Pseudomonas cannabina]|uniref:Uncharacterized protein n=2 Tax=Pseudomonas syringae group TaxID=136849 RepID=A0A3M3LQ11_PSECA|nr:hypothetical protein [Pseudomonas cannabina]RMN37420.1 hypothetical protein ALQ64_01917 [Pseudomonas cannabina]